jgi:indole-3-acetate monooxygenase
MDTLSPVNDSISEVCADGAGVANTAERMLSDIRALTPAITARAAEIEAERRMPPDLVEALRTIGVFRMFVPRSHGGFELDLCSGLEVISALARVNGSVGWNAMTGSNGGLFAPLLPRETYDRIYQNGPDVILAGSIQPSGTAEEIAGGWRVNGRWPFASGCQDAAWLMAVCVMTRDGKPLCGEARRPMVRGVCLPADHWEIEDTWHAMGLKGTGSHHIVLKDKTATDANFIDLENSTPCLPGALYSAMPQLIPLGHAANAVGSAAGALDELLDLANTGRQQFRAAVPLRESETFQFELGRVVAELRAARAFHELQAASYWRHALDGTLRNETLAAQGLQAGVWVVTACVRVADACFRLAGGSAVYESSPLQRRMRDLHTAAQHAAIHQRHYAAAGKVALAQSCRRAEEPEPTGPTR